MKHSIVIPTYNNCDQYLKPCVESIFKWTDMADIELIISANGCTDSTHWYLQSLRNQFDSLGFSRHLKIVWNDKALGYARATNEGIKASTCERVVLLNNDTLLLPQNKHDWIRFLSEPFDKNSKCGITCVVKGPSEPAGRDFAIFFCVMVSKHVFSKVGLLNEEYGVGGGEDTEFCIEAEKAGFTVTEVLDKTWDGTQFVSPFPIFHKGEGTMHNPELVKGWDNIFLRNSLKLAKKYNFDWYRWRLSNYWERAVFLNGDAVYPREVTRYKWANENLLGKKVLEIGCSNGYGTQFFPTDIDYTGVDYDPIIVDVAKEQNWGPHTKFFHADINQFELGQYDTIVAFEVVEHIDNGLEVVERLKQHCKRLLITVPMNEPPGFWGPHHKLHWLNESHFPGFEFHYINEAGEIKDTPDPITDDNHLNLLIARWTRA